MAVGAVSYRQCTRCIMDTTASGILFDSEGRCNFCRNFEKRLGEFQPQTPEERERKLHALVDRVRKEGRGKPYDCIVGLSGGADSAYSLYMVKKVGLRPLAIHMDNGWDSELAVNNIENLVRKLGVDYQTHVINWLEYRDLMQAFFDADVLDVELLYDNAMLAANYQFARKYNVRWILGGTNTTTEGMEMPANWNWFKYDKKNIKSIARRNRVRIETFPLIGTLEYVAYRLRTHWIPFLDYVDYFKPRCVQTLVDELGYRTYPYKHYESVFTRFYQGYILPKKFGVDKRKLHLSTLLISGQMTREEVMKAMETLPYPYVADQQSDIEYFIKKMGWSEQQLADYIARPQVPHAKYGTEKPLWDRLAEIGKRIGAVERRVLIAES